MQTFIPYWNLEEAARCLDWRRLGKQRVEARQILSCLSGGKAGWANHPAVKMWRGYEKGLAAYSDAMIREWVRRGYRNTMTLTGMVFLSPPWWGDERVLLSHRGNLLRKDPEWYGQLGWEGVAPQEGYFWPVSD